MKAAEIIDEPLPINLGGGVEITIRDLVGKVAAACGYAGRIAWLIRNVRPNRCSVTLRDGRIQDAKLYYQQALERGALPDPELEDSLAKQ